MDTQLVITAAAEEHFHRLVVPQMNARIMADSPLIREMVAIAQRYNGDYVVPTPDVEGSPTLPRTTPLLMAEAIDNMGRLGASVMFDLTVPIKARSGWTTEQARANATTRRQVIAATQEMSGFGLLRRRAFRQLAGYATYAMDVIPDVEMGMPRYRLLDPLLCYPEPKAPEDVSPIRNLGHIRSMSAGAIRATWPKARAELGGPICEKGPEEMWDLVEWTDADWCLHGVLGPRLDAEGDSLAENYTRGAAGVMLSAYPNRLGRYNGICPRRVTMSRIASQMTQLTGLVDLMDRLNALDIEAGERSLYPDVYIMGEQNGTPALISGEWKDGRTGEVNLIKGAQQVGTLRTQPDPNAKMMVDRLERNMRTSVGLVPQTGGETYGALRTGRGIDALMSASVDPRIQEIHEIDQHYQGYLASVVLDTYKAWWSGRTIELFSGWRADSELIEFEPSKDIPTSLVKASYVIPGADVSQTTITLGQLLGTKGISLKSFRRMHPWIEDSEAEAKAIDEEAMEDFALQAIMAQIQQQTLPLTYLAKLEKHRKKEHDIFVAIERADEEVRKEQAELAAQQQQMAANQPAPPEMQPGLIAPTPVPGGPPAPGEGPMVDPALQDRVSQANALTSALTA